MTQYVTEAPDSFRLGHENTLQCDKERACLNVHAKRSRSYHIDSFDRFMFVLAARQNSHSGNDNIEMNLIVIFLVFAWMC